MRKTLSKAVWLAGFIAVFVVAIFLRPSSLRGQATDPRLETSVQAARDAGVPEEVLNRILIIGVDFTLSTQELTAFLQALQTAQQEGLSIDPLMSKIDEGLAKGVSAQAINAVLSKKIGDFRFVCTLFRLAGMANCQDGSLSQEDLARMVCGLEGGISRDELTLFVKRAPAASVSMLARAIEVLALLKQIHFDKTLSEEILFAGLKYRSFTPPWTYLPKVVTVAKRRGMKNDEIATVAQDTLREKGQFKEFMDTLGFVMRDVRHGPAMGRRSRRAP